MDPKNSRSNYDFASLAQYSAQGRSAYSRKCVQWTHRLKDTPAGLVAQFCEAIQRAAQTHAHIGFDSLFGPDVLGVPAPGHALMKNLDAHWGPRVLCEVMARTGLLGGVDTCLQRTETMAKSAYARSAAERPDYHTHLNSLTVVNPCNWPGRILLVDDVITRGCTMAAGIEHLSRSFPEAQRISGFAFIRTMSHQEIPENGFLDPVVGTISLDEHGGVYREP